MEILKYVVLTILAVGAIFLAIAVGAGLLNRTPMRRSPPDDPPPEPDDNHQRGPQIRP
ncbi:hypothetical protein [Micromonospora sp. AMSO31t]|uniref:hypothetical protein n=1 Tax=Micromonospora sp. AMSO31t TaxID=2650566 RepID=UPI001788CCA1|nr:hypothetical protein [Micromonospora sp. AMSO31t]